MKGSDEVSMSSAVSSTSSKRPKKYFCDYDGCSNAYNRPSLLQQHQRTHTGERPFVCTQCSKAFSRKSHLTAHLQSHIHPDDKPYKCEVCNKGLNTLQHLRRHEKTHEKSFQCELCDEAFYKKQTLLNHKFRVHENVKKLTCFVCDKSFSRPSKFAHHNEKYHGVTPAYQCDHPGCFVNFKTWSALRLHVNTQHPKLECKVCGKKCVGQKGLQSHMLSHDDAKMVKVWNCNYCDVGKFAKKLDLLDHYNKFHDGNIPDELLKPNERLELSKLLHSDDKSLLQKKLLNQDSIDDDDGLSNQIDFSVAPRSHRSIEHFENSLSKKTVVGLFLDNFSSKRLYCSKNNCPRYFHRKEDLSRHLKWHDEHMAKIEAFLSSLDTDERDTSFNEPLKVKLEPGTDDGPPLKKVKVEAGTDDDFNAGSDDNYGDDIEWDQLIDLELKKIKAGSVV